MISLSKFLSDNLFLLAEVLSPAVEKIHSTEHSSSGGGGGGGVQMKNWIDFSCDLVIKLSWCHVVSFSFDRVSNNFVLVLQNH